MRKRTVLCVALGILGALCIAGTAVAATLSWTAPTAYTDGTGITAANQARITYTPYTGSGATGPWTVRPATAAGATSATVPDPSPGGTLWYTVEASLDGQTSAKAVAVSKSTPFLIPNPPAGVAVQ